MKKWFINLLLKCKWIKKMMYETLFEEYVKSIRNENFELKASIEAYKDKLRAVNKALARAKSDLEVFQNTIVEMFPIGDFDTVMAKLKDLAEKILKLIKPTKK